MSRYPNEDIARFDQQFAETEDERNARLKKKRMSANVTAQKGTVMNITDIQIEAAIRKLEKIIEAARNSNNAGEIALMKANAAGEMYEALSQLMTWIDNWEPAFVEDDEWQSECILFRAALAKARGEA